MKNVNRIFHTPDPDNAGGGTKDITALYFGNSLNNKYTIQHKLV
jgi:hypothetical protein